MLLRLWTQSSEKLYRCFKHIISGWGFKNITNHLKVLVQCGSIVPGSQGPIYRHGHCKEFPVNYMTTWCQQVFFKLLLLERLKSTPMFDFTVETAHFPHLNWVDLHNYIRAGAGATFPSYPLLLKLYLFFIAVPEILKKKDWTAALWCQIKTYSENSPPC